MKKRLLALLLALCMVLTMAPAVFAADSDNPALPDAKVTELDVKAISEAGGPELTFAMNFTASEPSPDTLAYYGSWYADFVLTINKDVTFNSDTTSGAGGYLAGQYDIAGPNWYVVPPKDVQYPANTPFKIMEYAFETMGEENFQLTYNDVCSFVQNFDCGIFFTKDFLDAAENQDLKVTLELIIYEPNNEYSYRIGPAYVFEPGKKVQEITLSSETETPSITKKGTYSAAGITDSPLIVNPGKDENVTLKLEGVEIYAGNMNSQVMFAAEGAMVAADEGDKVTTSAIEILSGNVTIDVADYENVLLGGENGAGIYVAEGASLTIVGNEGTLTAIGNNGADASDSGAAGIGGTKTNGNSGAITIDGAKVEARGYGVHGSGIGSGSGKVVGEIKIINGADVTAYGGYYADGAGTLLQSSYGKSDPEGGVGIGGGGKTVSTIADITIKDSKVTAYGGSKAAGIGSNFWSSCGKITIDNSTVIAQGGSSSAAIGTSRAGDNGVTANIDIKNKSNVTAKGGAYGAGIGGGYNNDSLGNGADASALPVTYIKIADSTINAAGGEGGAGIGGGYKTDNVDIDITGGNVTASAGALVSGKTVANGGAACAIGSGANGSGVFENSPEVELSGTYSVDATAYYGGKDAIEGVDTSTDTNVELTLIGQPGDTSWYDESKTEFTITTRDQLYGFADLVNSGVTFAGKTVKLAADIDLTGKVWTPIGTSIYDKNPSTADVKMFAGNFDGGNHTITGLSSDRYVPASSETASTEYSFGLFGYVYGANISNVKLANVDIDGTTRKDSAGNDVGGSGVAALIGYYYVENDKASVIENCHVLSGTVKASNNMGGLIGFIDSQKTTPQKVNITIKNCSNAADVTSEAREAGGIVGLLNASRDDYSPTMAGTITFKDCVNSGDITTLAGGGSTFAGGILGKDQNEYSNQQLKIIFDGCTNSGTITVEARGETHVAGIGTSFYSHGAWLVVKDSRNEGAIVVKNPENASPLYAGGLLGYAGVMDVLNSTSAGTVATGGGKYIGDVQNMVFVDAISDFNTINTGDVYYLNGGTSPEFEALVDDIAIWGGNFIVVKTAYKDGFDFGGWYDNKTYTGSPVTTLSEGSNLYYAKWSATLPGSGTEEDPYLIKNLTDLIIFRENVNYGNTYEGKYVSLDADIDLDGINWIPIGNDTNYFCGIFNGQDHIIKNMSIKANTPEANQFAGLFGGIKKATVKNLVMENVKIDVVGAKVRAAAVVGIAHSNSENRTDAKIFFENITVKGCDIKAESKAGSNMAAAIAAYCYPANHKNISVSDLTINGAANTGETSYLGGLVGYQQGQNISNNGNTRAAIEIDTFNLKNITINSKSNSVLAGGYAGYTYYGFITLKNGTVNGIKMNIDAGEALVGGMVGMTHRSDKGHTFADIDIKGIDFDVTTDYHGETRVGGMVGYSESPMAYTDCTTQGTIVEKCSDSANPVNHHAKVGGFVGRAYTWAQTFTNCTADVDVTSSHVAGGFVGNHITNAQYTNCEAKGDVKAHIAGGFAGILTKHNYSADVTFDGCKSSGNVEGNVVAGGFIGSTVSYGWADWGNADTKSPYAKNVTIKDCDVSGTVARTGGETAYVAGVVGEAIVADGVNITLNNVTYDVEPACYPAVASSSWYDENATEYHIKTHSDLIGFAELVDSGVTFEGKTVYLDNDIDLKNELFNPIGSYRHDKSFKGTFDGQNHSIKNLSQNTWELDNGYYYGDLGLGLFGLVEDATIKNLVMDGASISGESAICGTVAACAYGNCVFENIVVKNAEVADYQYYAGGLVGWASGDHEYINCDIDKSTTVAAQWGDFDNSTGGVIGGCGGSATIYMEDCDVACRLDVYNDVTSTYQWYAYRRCGMLVGNTGKTVTEDGTTYASAPQITAKNCTVTYGDWAVYTYCEFAGKSWPYVRAQAGISNSAYSNPRYGHPTDANGNEVVDDNHVHNDGEDHAILCIFDQLYGGGQGVYGEPAHEGVKVIYEWPVAENKDTDRVYATLASAIADAKDGETVVLLKNIDLTENDRIYGADRNVLVDVASGKDITLDMNSKKISVVHEDTFTNDYIVAVIRVADGAGLTVTGNGTIDVKANTNDPDIAYMFWKRGTTGHLTIENGTYHMNDSADSIVYTNGDEIVNIKGGTWTLDSVGTGENRSPWIFNVSGAGDNQVVVTGGTFNDNIQRQHWANEVMVPETYYVEKNDDNTWTVKSDAALYANEGILTGPYYVENWNIGYKSFDAFLEAANASDTDTIDLYDSITLLKDVVINVPLTNLDFNQNKHVVTIAENGSLTVRDAFTVSPVAAEGFILVTTENADGTVTYSVNGVYTVTFDAAGGSDVAPQTVNHGEKAVEPKEPTKSGFTFLGWTLDGAAYDFADAVTGNITLVASWAKNATEMEMYSVYKVEHYLENLDGTYTIVAADTKMYSAKVGSKVSATANTYDNYVVASADADVIVEKAAEGQDGKPVVTTLAVYYDLNKYTVTFNSAGGSAVAPQTVKHGGTAIEPKDPTNGDLVFMGWYNGKAEYDFADAVTGDITLTAKWAANAEEMEMYTVYKVEHWLIDIDGEYSLADEEFPLRAKVGEIVSAEVKTYEDYVLVSADKNVIVEKAVAGEDGKPVVTTLYVYYEYAFEPGDANHDGYVDSTDAVLILRHLAGYELEVYYEDTADFNRDGEDDSTDAVGILRKLAGLR